MPTEPDPFLKADPVGFEYGDHINDSNLLRSRLIGMGISDPIKFLEHCEKMGWIRRPQKRNWSTIDPNK